MDMYGISAQFWLAVASAGLLLPLAAVVAHETRQAVACLRGASPTVDSIAPHSHASAPSHSGL
jgi:hypothetical protein